MKTFTLALLFTSQAFAGTNLLLIGGGSRPKAALSKFSEIAGGKKSFIVVIPWASESTEGAENIKSELNGFENGTVEVASDSMATLTKQISQATGIFFTGGDQNKLMNTIKTLNLKTTFQQMYKSGIIFGGTSAGTAVMSNPMLTGKGDLSVIDGSQIELTEGLGLLPDNMIVDQHFIIRSRFNRLAGVILNQQDKMGIAVDEGTSFLIQDEEAKVIGPSQVMIFKKLSTNKLEITILAPGETLKL